MHLTTLTLDQFRSYPHCSLTLQPGLTLILGDNAQGKTNLLEAIYLLAALRSPRASSDGELIAWSAPPPAIVRVAGTAQGREGKITVEVAAATRTDANGAVRRSQSGAPLVSRRVRRNGIARRAADVVGAITAVLFTTLDMEIITGAPSARRRFLDFTIAQSDRAYARASSAYERALSQRNAALKRIARGEGSASELEPWDDALIAAGSTLVAGRAAAVRELTESAVGHHARLTGESGEQLRLEYAPALGGLDLPAPADVERVSDSLREALTRLRPRETAAGATLAGPHRDDLRILLDGRAAAMYASRAQQRSIALTLRLSEADLLRSRRDDEPILLLDDVFSELDRHRRAAVAQAVAGSEQVILTSADPAAVPPELPPPVATYRVERGRLTPI